MDDKLKEAVFDLMDSHSKLSQAEYERNPAYNNEHFAYKAEQNICKCLAEHGLLTEFLERKK